MEVWNLPEPHLYPSHLPSLLTEPLLSLLHFYPRAWGQSTLGNWAGGGYDTVLTWTADP